MPLFPGLPSHGWLPTARGGRTACLGAVVSLALIGTGARQVAAVEPRPLPAAHAAGYAAARCPHCGRFHAGGACSPPRRYPPQASPDCPPATPAWPEAPLPGDRRSEAIPPGDPLGEELPSGSDRARAEADQAIDRAGQSPADTSAQASNLGAASSAQSYAPYMIGDFFGGGGSGRMILSGPTTIGPGTPIPIALESMVGGLPASVLVELPPGFPTPSQPVEFISPSMPPFFTPQLFESLNNSLVDNNNFLAAQSGGTVATFAIPLAVNGAFSDEALIYVTALYPAGATLPTGQIAAGGGSLAYDSGSANFDAANSPPTDENSPRDMSPSDFYYLNWLYQYTPDVFTTPTVVIDLPNPSNAGGVLVGRMKIADNTSPIPRDRLFFNYSGFFNTPLAPGGVNVHRYVPGFEKTIFGGLASWEMRFPFASTLDNNFVVGGVNSDGYVKWGNMSVVYKMLLTATDRFLVSGGLQVAVPTAGNINVDLPGGERIARVSNSSVHLMPFLGALYTPNGRFFSQGFLQVDVDANGNPVQLDPTLSGRPMTGVGRLTSPTFLYADLEVGYWIYRAPTERTRLLGIAPALELHYNRSLQKSDTITTGNIVVGDFFDNFELINFTAGCYLQFSPYSILTLGYNTPIGGGLDQQFSGELRVAFNRRF